MNDSSGNPLVIGDFIYITLDDGNHAGMITAFGMYSLEAVEISTGLVLYATFKQVKKAFYLNDPVWIDMIQDKTNASQKEKPCVLCSRMNDIGVKGCWNCGSKIL